MHFCVCNTHCKVGRGQEARIEQIDFSVAFDMSTIRAFSIGIALWVFEVLCCLYSNSFCQTVSNVMSGVPQGNVFGPLLLFCTLGIVFPFWEIS